MTGRITLHKSLYAKIPEHLSNTVSRVSHRTHCSSIHHLLNVGSCENYHSMSIDGIQATLYLHKEKRDGYFLFDDATDTCIAMTLTDINPHVIQDRDHLSGMCHKLAFLIKNQRERKSRKDLPDLSVDIVRECIDTYQRLVSFV